MCINGSGKFDVSFRRDHDTVALIKSYRGSERSNLQLITGSKGLTTQWYSGRPQLSMVNGGQQLSYVTKIRVRYHSFKCKKSRLEKRRYCKMCEIKEAITVERYITISPTQILHIFWVTNSLEKLCVAYESICCNTYEYYLLNRLERWEFMTTSKAVLQRATLILSDVQ
jgi:hypothetical protein